MVPSFKNTALIFLEILFIRRITIFSCKQYEVITDLICIIEKVNISKMGNDISKRQKKHSSVFLKGRSNKQKLFSMTYALSNVKKGTSSLKYGFAVLLINVL